MLDESAPSQIRLVSPGPPRTRPGGHAADPAEGVSLPTEPRATFTDPDGLVTIRLTEEDTITVTVTVAALHLPPDKLARIIVKAGEDLPRPDADRRGAFASGLTTIAALNQTLADGGWAAFDKAMRTRLGLDPIAPPIAADPDTDAALAEPLGKMVRKAQAASGAADDDPSDPPAYQAVSPEEDLAVTADTEYPIASLWIGPSARDRGVDGFGEALTALIAEARAELKKHLESLAREQVPAAVFDGMERVPGQAQRAEQAGMSIIDQADQMVEQLKRKASRA